ncbi:MAG: ferritin, partial [Chloroflexi bacterium]|nr:ferritin [Chloroflexota bacterium]
SVAREMGVSIQYMWHHVMALGLASPAVKDIFKDISITEMKHAEAFAERLFYLGGIPTSKPTEIKMGGDLRKMLQDDLEAETYALRLYREAIRLCREADDAVTRLLYEKVLAEEEEHYHTFSVLLSELKP